jgi:hypothetical protein
MILKIKPTYVWLGTGLIIIISRLLFASNGLWHNDAADFIRAAQQWLLSGTYATAHAPDYPGWNLLLYLWLLFRQLIAPTSDLITWSNFLNVVLGSCASFLLGYFIWLRQKNHLLASGVVLIFAFNPLFWLHQQTSLSDVAALFFLIALLVLLQINLIKNNWKYYLLISLTTFSLLSTRFASVINLLPIGLWLIVVQYQQKKKLLLNFLSLLIGFGMAVLLYLAINHGLAELLAVSRRVTPTLLESYLTIKNLVNGNNLLFVLLTIGGLYFLIKEKNNLWILLSSGLLINFYYVAGWWRAGDFDVSRYALAVAIYFAIGATYFVNNILKNKFWRRSFVGFIIILGLTIFINNSCQQPIYLLNLQAYCQISRFHKGVDAKQSLYTAAAPSLPYDAIVFIPDYDWSYAKLFLKFQNLNQRQIIYFSPTDSKQTIDQMNKYSLFYIFENQLSNQEIINELESKRWSLQFIGINNHQRLIVVEKELIK